MCCSAIVLVSLSLFNAVSVSSVSAVIKDLKKIPFSWFSLVCKFTFSLPLHNEERILD